MKNYSEAEDKQYHIQVGKGDVGKYVILPGDPKRCAKIAEYFDDPQLMADSREYVTYTGYLDGVKVSVTSTGIGGPSAAIAVEELVKAGADTFIRVGTCGAINKNIHVRDTILANSACTDSAIITQRFGNLHYAPSANFDLLYTAYNKAKENNINVAVGPCASSDLFYDDNNK